jgi:tRNA (adenine57-N1/adenine58-N1)-methyltransferase
LAICTKKRTQILYQADISIVLLMLDILPGKTVVEAGTGTGIFSTYIASCIAPNGHLYTFEFHKQRAQAARLIIIIYNNLIFCLFFVGWNL